MAAMLLSASTTSPVAPENHESFNGKETETSHFQRIPMAPTDLLHVVIDSFDADINKVKLNLGIRAFRTEDVQPYVLNVVKKAEKIMLEKGEHKEYLPVDGLVEFNKITEKLVLGDDNPIIHKGRVATIQTVAGTGALRLATAFIERYFPGAMTLISSPTWGNHKGILNDSRVPWSEYRYYDPKTAGIDFDGMLSDIKRAPNMSFILLHGCAHNPTGCDLTQQQWTKVADIIKEKNHIPFIDLAYHGFASGSLYEDTWCVRLFVEKGMEVVIAQSFGKNMGLYAERVGALNVVCSSPDGAIRVKSQLKGLVRPMYSNPPVHGARIVTTVVEDPTLFKEWKDEMKMIAGRVKEVREKLFKNLCSKDKSGKDWSFINKQVGLFSVLDLNKAQTENLVKKWHVHISGERVSLAGLPLEKCDYLAEAIIDTYQNII